MKSYLAFLAFSLRVLASALVSGTTDTSVTVTVTRTFTTCPIETCDITTGDTTSYGSSSITISATAAATSIGASTLEDPSTVDATSTQLTRSTNSAPSTTVASTTSSSPSATSATPTAAASSTTASIISPGKSFTPSATLILADINVDPQIIVKRDPLVDLNVPVTVYIDASTNPNAAVLTTDPLLATSFVIDTQTTLSTTLRSYPYQCGGSDFQNTPGRFYCDNSGAIPQTFRGWVNSPTFTYKDWIFCYTSPNLGLYMSNTGPTADCRQVTFTIDGSTVGGLT